MQKLIEQWKKEESVAHIHGWDFSHIDGRYVETTDFGWDYKEIILRCLTSEKRLLDLDTGGGEFLLTLGHPPKNLAATEGYPPNVALCKNELLPLGIDFKEADCGKYLPFDDESFDIVINRHGDLNEKEIFRVLKKGGLFITQQVGAENDRELVDLLMPKKLPQPFPEQYLSVISDKFQKCGFEIIDGKETFGSIRFFDVGALVWFARIIEWEFIDFSVDTCIDGLMAAQKTVDEKGSVEGRTHRFMLVAKKTDIK